MRKRINLLTKQIEYKGYEKFFQILRVYLIGFFGIFLVLFGIVYVLLFSQNSQKQKLLADKENLIQYLNQQREVEAKFMYFDSKYSQLKNYLRNDVNFEPYYKILNDSLKLASPEPELENLKINEKRVFSFDLNFSGIDNILVFLKFAETEKFLQNFEKLTLIGFNFEQTGQEKGTNYQLKFEGIFKKI